MKDDKKVNQIGDICPHCKKEGTKLVYAYGSYPYSDEHLWCKECNSTFLIKYKQMWTDDVNALACDMHDVMESEFEKRGMKLNREKSDEIYDKLTDILDEFGTGDYRQQMG